MRGRGAWAIASNNLPIDTLSARSSGAHVDLSAVVAQEEGDGIVAANESPVGRTVAVVVSADSVLVHITVGPLGDGAEVELFCSSEFVGHADREGGGRVAEDAVGSAPTGCGPLRGCGCEVKDGSEAE